MVEEDRSFLAAGTLALSSYDANPFAARLLRSDSSPSGASSSSSVIHSYESPAVTYYTFHLFELHCVSSTTSTVTKWKLVGGTEPTQPPGKSKKQAAMTTQSPAIKAM